MTKSGGSGAKDTIVFRTHPSITRISEPKISAFGIHYTPLIDRQTHNYVLPLQGRIVQTALARVSGTERDFADKMLERHTIAHTVAGTEAGEIPPKYAGAVILDNGEPVYGVERFLAAGGMGHVYAGQSLKDHEVGKYYAIKFLIDPSDSGFVARFLAEAERLAAIRNPNIIRAYGAFPHDGTYCMVVDLLEGMTLFDVMRRIRPLTPREAVQITLQIANGLMSIHENGIIHRDIKPDNIWIKPDGVVILLDFGLSRLEGVQGLTAQGMFAGTPNYASPEQARGENIELTTKSDIYSVGILLYEMLTGEVPLLGQDDIQTLIRRGSGQLPNPLPSAVPKELADLVLSLLSPASEKRPDFRLFEAMLHDMFNVMPEDKTVQPGVKVEIGEEI